MEHLSFHSRGSANPSTPSRAAADAALAQEPAKFVAKLRRTKTDSNLLLLKCELGAGHFSVTGRFERLKETALEYAFLLKTQGRTRTPQLAPPTAAVTS